MAMPGSSSTMKIKAESSMLNWQPNGESGSSIQFAGDFDHATMIGDNAIGHRKTQAGTTTVSLGGKEWLKNTLLVNGSDPQTAILYRHAYPLSILALCH